MKQLIFTEPIHKVQHEGLQCIFKHDGHEYYASISQFEPHRTLIGAIERSHNGEPVARQIYSKTHKTTSVQLLIKDIKTFIETP